MSGSLPTQDRVLSLDDVAPSWLWTVDIVNVGSLPNLENVYIQAADVPIIGIQSESRFRGGKYYSFPKYSDIATLNLTFYETGSYDVTGYLEEWSQLVRTDDGVYGLPTDYMGTAVLNLYDTAGNNAASITIYGLWPLRRGHFNLSYTSSGEMVVTCEFAAHSSAISAFNSSVSNYLASSGSGDNAKQSGIVPSLPDGSQQVSGGSTDSPGTFTLDDSTLPGVLG